MQNDAEPWKRIEILAYWYSSKSTQRELSDEYQHDRVWKVFYNLCILVLWVKVVSALERLRTSLLVAKWITMSCIKKLVTAQVSIIFNTPNTVLFSLEQTRLYEVAFRGYFKGYRMSCIKKSVAAQVSIIVNSSNAKTTFFKGTRMRNICENLLNPVMLGINWKALVEY